MAEDELTPRAAELVLLTGKASTSMMQTKLKVGFNRASRLMDELERVGIVGPQDPRNPAVPRAVYGPDNWIRCDGGRGRALGGVRCAGGLCVNGWCRRWSRTPVNR